MTIETKKEIIYQDIKRWLKQLGYTDNLLLENYKFADFLSNDSTVKTVQLAAFSQYPPSYQNACFGIVTSNGDYGESLVSNFFSLGAPQILEISSNGFSRWGITSKVTAKHLENVESHQIDNFFQNHKEEWSPDNFNRLKTFGRKEVGYQPDFFDEALLPTLDREVQLKFDKLLSHIIYQITHEQPSENDRPLFRLIFRLIAAKLFADRNYRGEWLNTNPQEIIKNVESIYFKNEQPPPVLKDTNIQNTIWENIKKSFHFQNLSIETLAYVYENTLVTKDFRKRTGTHGTPPSVAEYVVRHLPIQELKEDERYIFEPFSGHAVFLLAALRHLRSLLDQSLSTTKRHNYFVKMLSGLEYDEFAIEVARLSLTLADHPNPNGWNLQRGDVFQGNLFKENLVKANIILCNPPFEDFHEKDQEKYKNLQSTHRPEEILLRVLATPPKMIGFIVPRIFVAGHGYKRIRNSIADIYSSVEIVALPDNVFKFSEAETVLLLASGEKKNRTFCLTVSEVYKSALEQFYLTDQPPTQTTKQFETSPHLFNKSMWLRTLPEIWEYTSKLPLLEKYADIHRGIEYNVPFKQNEDKLISKYKKPEFFPGLRNADELLEAYLIVDHHYLRVSDEWMRTNAHKFSWENPKVITNAARRTRGHWKLTAAVDYLGLYCYQRLHGIWTKDHKDMPLEIIAALLNGPLANAYMSTSESERSIKVETLKEIPIPIFSEESKELIIKLVEDYRETRQEWINIGTNTYNLKNRCNELLFTIDAEILKAYNFPPKLERKLLDYFGDYERPVPFTFSRYYPEGFKPFVPLHIYISKEFQDASIHNTLERLTLLSDESINQMIINLETQPDEKD
ncbi:MAG: N-6 DNA methylase [Dehalococcoidales bacterium]|nr:N-6 DNA methylase [Dehalococcoidales bacterium]